MIEEILGPSKQSLLKLDLDLVGFTDDEMRSFRNDSDLMVFQPSSTFSGAWISSWADWISLDQILVCNLSPDLLAFLLVSFAEVFERHAGDDYSLSWDCKNIYYQLAETEGEYELKLDSPYFIRSKTDESEEFFQNLLEIYLKSDELTTELANTWLLARDEEWPILIEAILDRELSPQNAIQTSNHKLKIQRIENTLPRGNDSLLYLPPPIPLACITQIPPSNARLTEQQIFWIEGRCVIGSSPERADYLLRSSLVLPEHCELMYGNDFYNLRTMGLGTVQVDGKKIGRNESYVLPGSCMIEIADVKLYFFMETESDRLIA